MLPGLRSDPPGSIRVSAATVGLKAEQIELTLNVTVQRAEGGSLHINLPRFGWLGESEPYPDRQFPELAIHVDGAPATVEDNFRAFVASADVTDAIRKAGVDPFAIADTPPFIDRKGSGAELEALERLGAVEKSGQDYLAKWTVERKLRFHLSSGAHSVTLIYKSRPAYGLVRVDQLSRPAYSAKYCVPVDDVTKAFGLHASSRVLVATQYAIAASIDGSPLQSLSVAVDEAGKKESRQSLIALCGADGKAAIGRTGKLDASARTDAQGKLKILAIGLPEGSK